MLIDGKSLGLRKRKSRFSFPSLIGVQHSLPVSDLDEAVMVFAAGSVLFEGTTVQSYSKQMLDCCTFPFSFPLSFLFCVNPSGPLRLDDSIDTETP